MGNNLPSISVQLKLFFQSPVFLACFSSWFGAQFIKTAINLCYGRIKSFKQLIELMLVKTGGMPSSHSALVTALMISVGIRNGLDSDIFLIACVLNAIVIRDAFGVRRSNGQACRRINEVTKELGDKDVLPKYTPIKEVNGHKPMEVICGSILGLFVALGFTLL